MMLFRAIFFFFFDALRHALGATAMLLHKRAAMP